MEQVNKEMVAIQTKIVVSIPKYCPECEKKNVLSKLNHVNAIDTEAKLYMVFCLNPKCRFCKDYYFKNGEILNCR